MPVKASPRAPATAGFVETPTLPAGGGGGPRKSPAPSTAGFGEGTQFVPNSHFTQFNAMPLLPWEMQYDLRRGASHDPRIVKQVQDEQQWDGTPVQGVWQRIRVHCHPHKDWNFTPEESVPMFQGLGVMSPHLASKLFLIFKMKEEEDLINGLVICKMIQLGLQLPEHQSHFVRHCFDRFDRGSDEDFIDKRLLERVQLADPSQAANTKSKGKPSKAKNPLPLQTKAGATFGMVQGLKEILKDFHTEEPNFVTFEEFKRLLLDPANFSWVGNFTAPLLEAVGSRFGPPLGERPYVSVRWLKTTVPVPTSEDLHDADSLLLKELEKAGGVDPNAKKKKPAKKAASPKKKK